jgi:transcriptional/translational regulatory protein YebC/TACO1
MCSATASRSAAVVTVPAPSTRAWRSASATSGSHRATLPCGDDGAIEVLCAAPDYEALKAALEAADFKPEIAEVTMRAENTIPLVGLDAERMQKLLDVLEDLDDVQDVFHNAEIGE